MQSEGHYNKTQHVRVSFTDGYWSFIAITIPVLFLFYVTGKGELQQWINLLVWNPGKAPSAQGAGELSTNPAPVQGVAPGLANYGKGSNTPGNTPIVPGGGTVAGSIFGWVRKQLGQ